MSLISFLNGTTNSAISSRTLWTIFWQAKTSNKPISQNTWLVLNPSLNSAPSFFGDGGSIYTPKTLHHSAEVGLAKVIYKGSTRLPLHCMLTPCMMLTKLLQQDAHLEKQHALKASRVWSRGLPATLQISNSYHSHW